MFCFLRIKILILILIDFNQFNQEVEPKLIYERMTNDLSTSILQHDTISCGVVYKRVIY